MPPPYSVLHLEVTDSTQDDARDAFDGRPVLVVAGGQRAGRGRAAGRWENAPRAMAASLAFRPEWEPDSLPLIPLLAGVAAARAVDCGLKWPNDLIVDDLKVGGILVEASDGVVVAGCGMNLWWPDPPEGFGAMFSADPGPAAAVEVAESWAETLLTLVEAGPQGWPRDEYRRRSVTVGREITWAPDGAGRAVDIAADGGLVVVTHEGRTTLHAGEIRHVRMV
ncbi:MAG: biotin--[acetyl-CoA-carboxylase] ligase [Acidimicrobiia bacterium]|nr:biotin--[acetyl-CoA-carboxylase] ligase [Acidimicrobiia bacterium]